MGAKEFQVHHSKDLVMILFVHMNSKLGNIFFLQITIILNILFSTLHHRHFKKLSYAHSMIIENDNRNKFVKNKWHLTIFNEKKSMRLY